MVDGEGNGWKKDSMSSKDHFAKIDESHEAKRIRGNSGGFDKLPNSSLLWDYLNVLGISEKYII